MLDDLVESLDGLLHLVVLRGDEGDVAVAAVGKRRRREPGLCRVGLKNMIIKMNVMLHP